MVESITNGQILVRAFVVSAGLAVIAVILWWWDHPAAGGYERDDKDRPL